MGKSIPTAPHGSGGGSNTTPSTSTGGSGGGSSSSGGSSGGGGDPYLAAQRKAQHKAAQRYLQQAATLQSQADSLALALGRKGFRAALATKLGNIRRDVALADSTLLMDYSSRIDALQNTADDNAKAAGGQAYAAQANAGRERANAMSEAMAQGAGESDMLRAQGMALRNWNANQNEVSRNFYDTATSIDASANDMTADTRTARINTVRQANADRDLLWTNYYDRMSETQTQLGNVYGQMADYYASANEMGAGAGKKMKRARRLAKQGWMDAAETAGEAWRNPGVRAGLRQWEGQDVETGALTTAPVNQTTTLMDRPEGASLRRWDA